MRFIGLCEASCDEHARIWTRIRNRLRRKMTSPSNQNRLSQLAATRLGARLFRVNVGLSWVAPKQNTFQAEKTCTVTMHKGDVLLRQGRPMKSGVEGMSDNGGFVPVTVTESMVGQKIAMSLWVEDKSGIGRPSTEQKAFIQMIRSFGGRAGVARNDEDVAKIIRGEICD